MGGGSPHLNDTIINAIQGLLAMLTDYHSSRMWQLPLRDGRWRPVPPPSWAGPDLENHTWFRDDHGSLVSVV
jgi:hypothetical protein